MDSVHASHERAAGDFYEYMVESVAATIRSRYSFPDELADFVNPVVGEVINEAAAYQFPYIINLIASRIEESFSDEGVIEVAAIVTSLRLMASSFD